MLFIYLFLVVLGLCCYVQAFYSCREQGLLFIVVCGLLIVVAVLVAEHRKETHELMGFSSCSRLTQWLLHMGLVPYGMWDLPRPVSTCVPCTGRQSLIHCTTREVLLHIVYVF